MTSKFAVSNNRRIWRAFTLVELLVVVAIIGILATVVVISYSGAQDKARDSRRVSDIQTISQAIQLEANTRGSSTYYDSACSGATYAVTDIGLNAILAPTYFGTMPLDPVSRNNYYNTQYVYESSVYGGGHNCVIGSLAYTSTGYYLWTGLDVSGSSLANDAGTSGGATISSWKTGAGSGSWNTTVSQRQNVNNFYLVTVGAGF